MPAHSAASNSGASDNSGAGPPLYVLLYARKTTMTSISRREDDVRQATKLYHRYFFRFKVMIMLLP